MTSASHHLIYAVIPAAGASRRMGQPKLLMRHDDHAMIDTVLTAILDGGANGVVVVCNAAIADYLTPTRDKRIKLARNDDPESEMIDSVRIGLEYWRDQADANANPAFLVTPADHPGLNASAVRRCVDAARRDRESIIIGSYAGKRGHPLIFPNTMVSTVFSSVCDQGLNGLRTAFADCIVYVETDEPGAVQDVDTPEDFKRLDG